MTSTSSKIKTFDDLSNKERYFQLASDGRDDNSDDSEYGGEASLDVFGTRRGKDFRKVLESMETRSKEMEQLKIWTRRVYEWWRENERNEKMKLEEKLL